MQNVPATNPPPAPTADSAVQMEVPALPTEVPILNENAWREYRDKPGLTTLNSVHIALVADESGVERLCYVKMLPDMTSPTLLCEAMGWVLAGHAGLRRADFAAFLFVDKDKLGQCQTLTYECMTFAGPLIPAWCTEAIPGSAIMSGRKGPGMQFIQDQKTFLNSKDARKFAAFDKWTGLRDRNMGNVIRHKAGGYASIDHETMLHDILWGHSHFNLHDLVSMAEAEFDAKRVKAFKSEMTRAAAGHAGALAGAKIELQALLNLLLPGEKNKHADALGFLDARSQSGWLANQLGVIDMAPKKEEE
ncbi:MAG: hypothetical protein KA740_02185 [Rhodoferax sp.]|jgi:hypothetical protein|nr:hypothetical protein [Rhodoferax sp.]